MNNYYSLNINMDSNIKKFTVDVNNLTELLVKKEIKNLLTSISVDYNIPKNEIFKKYLADESVDDNDQSNIVINHCKCIAVTKNYKQCSRNKYSTHDFCKNHLKQSQSANGLPQGTIHSIIPANNTKQLINYVSNIDENETVLEKITIKGQEYYVDRINNQHYIKNEDSTIEKVNL